MPSAVEVIQTKRNGLENTSQEIRWLVAGAISGEVPDYQVAAWLMAAFLRGLEESETMALTRAFVDSGRRLDFDDSASPPRVDKHSTGGVGDKTSLVIAPLVASAGFWVPMISGRGLGFTGGTLDKLEAIPDYRSNLSLEEFQQQVARIGAGIVGTTRELAPGDRVFYRIRDVTATVECIPLIVASILSKKVAEDLSALVLDVKVGSGALMKDAVGAEALARALVDTGSRLDLQVVSLISDMSQPLGLTIGNALEVEEAVDTLQGKGPADFRQLCLELSAWMLWLGGEVESTQEGLARVGELLDSGQPFELFQDMVAAQGGNPDVLLDGSYLGHPRQHLLRATESGFVTEVHAEKLGRSALRLGAGRKQASDPVDPLVGIRLHRKVSDAVKRGDPLATLYYNQQALLDEALELAATAFRIGVEPVAKPQLIHKVVK